MHSNSLAQLDRLLPIAKSGKRIVFVSGTFNVLHVGHLRMLRFAAECGDYLVVGIHSNQRSASAILDEQQRHEAVSAVGWVDDAFVLHDSPEDFILALKPPIVVKGKEHEQSGNEEQHAVNSYGGKLLFSSGDTVFSSLNLLKSDINEVNYSAVSKPRDYPKRHQFDLSDLLTVVDKFASLRICVIGDTIVDEYIQCDALGMSQEDPTIVVTPVHSERFVGGAAIVAAHAKALGARQVDYISFTGDDDTQVQLAKTLTDYGVTHHLYVDPSRPTTLKQRFRAGNKTLLRVNHLRQHKVSVELMAIAMETLTAILDQTDLLVFSDFNYGALPQALVDWTIEQCRERGVMMVADSQCSSQIGDISRFKHMELVTPTEREARIALDNYEDGLVVLAEKLRQKSDLKNVIITLAGEGLLIHAPLPNSPAEWLTDRLPAMNSAPKDPAGAGDCLFITAAMALRVGCNIWQSVYLGSLSAACQVGRVGNLPLKSSELKGEISSIS